MNLHTSRPCSSPPIGARTFGGAVDGAAKGRAWSFTAIALTLALLPTDARAASPPSGWHAGKAPPVAVSATSASTILPGFTVLGAFDVPIADLPVAADGQGDPPSLFVGDDLAPFPRTWQPDVHGTMQFTVLRGAGTIQLNDERAVFGPSIFLSAGVRHRPGSTAKNTGPFVIDVMSGAATPSRGTPTAARFDHVEGMVQSDYSTRTTRWVTGEAVPTAWGIARALRLPGDGGEALLVDVDGTSLMFGADHDSTQTTFMSAEARVRLSLEGLSGAADPWRFTALVVDVSPSDGVVRFRVVQQPPAF